MRGSAYWDGPYPGADLLRNKRAYCAACGYKCVLYRDEWASSGRSPGWDKIRALRAALGRDGGCSLALWLDADVVVMWPVALPPLTVSTPIAATKDYFGFNTGVMLLERSPSVNMLLKAAWGMTEFVPNKLGAEQSAVRYALYLHSDTLRKQVTIYQNLVRYPAGFAMTARQKWNKTARDAAPIYHAAGCAMNQQPATCAEWLRAQLEIARTNWQGEHERASGRRLSRLEHHGRRRQNGGGAETRSGGGSCRVLDSELTLPRKLKGSDSFIPYGQGRDIVVNTSEAAHLERMALQRIEQRLCETRTTKGQRRANHSCAPPKPARAYSARA